MKQGLHPRYQETTIVCGTCATVYPTRSTRKGPIKTELCANCHPFFTGEQRIIDTAGQVDRFMRRMQLRQEQQKSKKADQRVTTGTVTGDDE